MPLKTLAVAAALTLAAAPAFADPAHVVQDTGHKVVNGTRHIVSGTYHGVAHQVGNVGRAGRTTGHDITHGVRRVAHRHSRHVHHHHDAG